MKSENTNGVATRDKAVVKKKTEVTCWNCLTSEGDRDVEPIPLSKVRKQHREKLRLYSFIASQVSKPRAVPLKQRVSENYSEAKKLDERISREQQSKKNDTKEDLDTSSKLNDNIFTDDISQRFENLTAKVKEFPDINASIEQLKTNIEDGRPAILSSSSFINVTGEFKDLSEFNKSNESNISEAIHGITLSTELKDSPIFDSESENELIEKYEKILAGEANQKIQPDQKLQKIDGTSTKVFETKENNTVSSRTNEKISTLQTKREFVKSNSTDHESNKTKDVCQGVHTLLSQKELPAQNYTNGKPLKQNEDNTATGNINSSDRSLCVEKVLPRLEDSCGKVARDVDSNTFGDINESSQTLAVYLEGGSLESIENTENRLRDIDKDYTMNDNNNKNLNDLTSGTKKSLKLNITPKTILKKKYDNSSFAHDPNDFKPELQLSPTESQDSYKVSKTPEEIKVLNKVLVETSTPRKNKTLIEVKNHKYSTLIEFKKQDDIIEEYNDETDGTVMDNGRVSSTSDKIDNASCSGSDSGYAESSIAAKDSVRDLSSPEPTSLTSDKIDNASCSGSDCGYTESSSNVAGSRDLASPESHLKTEPLNKSCLRQNFKSSLPSIPTTYSLTAKSTTSLYSPMSTTKKTPEKYIRWSTLSIHQKPMAFGDETYVSDAVSPGHATLPRRSHSPLPHERDLGDRYSLNRSGLQARSESMASVYSGAGEGLRGSVTVRGDVQFSLLYNYRLGALEVGVRRCRDLAPVDTKRNRSDPYVKVYLLPDKSKTGKRKTKVKKNTLNPIFEETLSFVQPLASLSSRTLWLSVWHADMFGRNDFLGEVTLPLADVVFDDAAPMWYKLHERTEQFDEQQGTRGDLIIGLKFEMAEPGPRAKGTLHVLVKEAKNVVATKPNGLADVFCKSYLLPERGRLAKQKTTVCRRTLSPRWEHTFTYRGLTMQELATRALELSLWDRDRLASNDFMGAVRLSLGTGTYMGANVNWMDSVGKEVTLWQTMMQRPNFWVEGSLPLRPQLNN